MRETLRVSSRRDRRRLQKSTPSTEKRFLTEFESVALGHTGFFFRDGFLGPLLSHQLRTEAKRIVRAGRLRPAGIGREGNVAPGIRGDHLCWIDPALVSGATKVLMSRLEHLRKCINRQFYLGLDRFEMQLALYPDGSDGYRRHLDAFKGKNARNRRLTAILYLNPLWKQEDGGELALHLPGNDIFLEPMADRLVVFFSEQLEHAVLPVKGERLALTAWFHAP
jgi:SM-20-related protein